MTKVRKSPNISLRSYLAWHGVKKDDLTKSHEGRVRVLRLFKAVDEVSAHNVSFSDEEIDVAINEATRR
jgi:hypothetical protein